MKGFIHVCKVEEKLDHTSSSRRIEFDVGKLNAPMIR